jgi:hypothetical protein
MTGKIRRIVTSQVPGSPARIFSDEIVPNVHQFTPGGIINIDIWKTEETPTLLTAGFEEPASGPMKLLPPSRGHVFRITEFPPESTEGADPSEIAALFANMDAATAVTQDPTHSIDPRMHRTETLDYALVLEGAIVLLVGADEVVLSTGDVVIQRGSDHAWINRSASVCRIAFFMVGARYAVVDTP